ncbi:FIST C-terminal domain-containing protein [bacterium]|nr:FIST C-terminal domain-containing protein [bacterium]
MRLEQFRWSQAEDWEPESPKTVNEHVQLVFLFGSRVIIKNQLQFDLIKKIYPKALLIGCSTAGEIYDGEVRDETLVVTAVQFEHSRIKKAFVRLGESVDAFKAGSLIAESLDDKELKHVFILSDGLNVNGSMLVKGLLHSLPGHVMVTGGLSGDGDRFGETYVYWGDRPESNAIVAVGFYGSKLKVGYGSMGGWDSFGPERLITRSEGNVLFEFDGQSALDLYKRYLGDHAKGLPATGLLFPLSLREKDGKGEKVRTILGINEEQQSLTFAGDVPEGAYGRLMKANFDRLIDGAIEAAKASYETIGSSEVELAVLISCVGRKMVLKQRIEEEVEGVREVLGRETVLAGFYSYGELSPFTSGESCALHNQTMTITTFSES